MQDYLTSTFHRHINYSNGAQIEEIGLELLCHVEGTQVFLAFINADTDYELIPQILPEERFESGSVHVSELTQSTDINDEIVTILGNASEGDSLIFFCESSTVIEEALSALAYNNN